MTPPKEISISELSRLIGTPDAPTIVDVCIDEDFQADPRLIPTSFRHPHTDITALAPVLTGSTVVVVCQKGLKLSQGAAAILRTRGIAARFLEGGVLGWAAADEPLIPADKLPPPGASGNTLWVTRHRPKIDRIACPWLIRRFIDPGAEFLFVEPEQVRDVADRFDAIPFDIEDVLWSHRGENCTFDTMLEEFSLTTEPLARLAKTVRGADTNRHDLVPEAAGLLAVSLGFSQMYEDDLEQLDAGLALYDAFYHWARDASDEGHSWAAALKVS
ncbi:MAG: sulfurtransferase/chromate resistance protein [Hyphomicrobiaceae bacterium]|nr:sulfurtransferase/chromate resistance protein [Hyphomicrobiaceae bacterium]